MTKLVAIVGPTASGKTDLAVKVAQQFDGEIICGDSRTIYRGMDIGTAKPTKEQQDLVPHHMLDIIKPDQTFSAAEFKAAANQAIDDIRSRNKLPILVGGSGLYIYSVIYDYQFPAGPDNELRQQLQSKSIEELVEQLEGVDPRAADEIDLKNPRRVIRAIETAGQPKTKAKLLAGTILIGLRPSDEELSRRIAQRTDKMLADGLEAEVKGLVDKYGPDLEALRSPGYAEVVEVLEAESYDFELPDLIDSHTHQLAKRQMTWFKRNHDTKWFDNTGEAYEYIAGQLQ